MLNSPQRKTVEQVFSEHFSIDLETTPLQLNKTHLSLYDIHLSGFTTITKGLNNIKDIEASSWNNG